MLAMTDASTDTAAGDFYLLPGAHSLIDTGRTEERKICARCASRELLSATFSGTHSNGENANIDQLLQGILDDGALYLSTTASPEQYVVLRCISRGDTTDVALLLEGRLETLRRQYRYTEWEQMTESAQILIIKKYILLIVSPHSESAAKAAENIIR
jgi:hypothetical protein